MLEEYPEIFCAYQRLVLRGVEIRKNGTKGMGFLERREATRQQRIQRLNRRHKR